MDKKYQNRRDFIKHLAMTGSAVALAASPWLGAFGSSAQSVRGANDMVRMAIIGTGSRGCELLRHLLTFSVAQNIRIVALCDNYNPHLLSYNFV